MTRRSDYSTINSTYLVVWRSTLHLLILTYKSTACNFVKIFHIWFQCSDKKPFVYMNIIFKYIKMNSFKYFRKIQLMDHWKLFDAFVKLKKIINHSNNSYFVRKTVNHSSLSIMQNLWKTVIMSNFMNRFVFEMLFNVLWINNNE